MKKCFPQSKTFLMNDKEYLFFVGECLTLDHYPAKIEKIKEIIRSKEIVWERIVWYASGYLVLPAFYLNLKRAGLIAELPEELVQYFEEITILNRQRNQQIIKQAVELTALLNQHDIAPVFLKGTAHLLDGLYTDIAERMVGDIDILVSKQDMPIAAEILLANGYNFLGGVFPKGYLSYHRHYPRLVKPDAIAAIEIHWSVMTTSYEKHFNFSLLNKDKKPLNISGEAYSISPSHQLIYNMMLVQMNDFGFIYGDVHLKHMYDLFLFSQANNPLKVLDEFGRYFHRLNAYLYLSATVMGNPACLTYKPNCLSKLFLWRLKIFMDYPMFSKIIRLITFIIYQIIYYFKKIFQLIYMKEMRKHLYYFLSNPDRIKKHLDRYKGA